MRTCEVCETQHEQDTSPICQPCRRKGSKKPCLIKDCTNMIDIRSRTCLSHRRHPDAGFKFITHCIECETKLQKGEQRVCNQCHDIYILCKCDCGNYRKKYSKDGYERQYISGHQDNWIHARKPPKKCVLCDAEFKSKHSRQKLCSRKCTYEWMRINPPNQRKRVPVKCAVCDKIIFRYACELKIYKDSVCSKECRVILVSNKLRGRNITSPKRLALKRDQKQCVICEFNIIVEVHHIFSKKKENGQDVLENLVTLCPNHHAMAERDLISKAELLSYITSPLD